MAYLEEPDERDVFILGAGFSRAVSKAMPLMRDLTAEVERRLTLNSAMPQAVPFLHSDIELALTYLAEPNPWIEEWNRLRNRALLLEISDLIGKVIAEATDNVLLEHPACPVPLSHLVHWLHAKRATIITLNYDTLLERAFGSIPVRDWGTYVERLDPRELYPIPVTRVVRDLWGAPHVNTAEVLKLHGSQNWFYSGRPEYSGEDLHYTHTRAWDPDISDGSRDDLLVGGRVPLIIPPLSEKSGFFGHEQIRFLWRRAAKALRKAKRIYCIGYSLPTTDHTMRFLFHANKPNRALKFYLVNLPQVPTPEGGRIPIAEYYRALLPEYYEVDCTFVADDPLQPFVRRLMQDDPITAMGDPVAVSPSIKERLDTLADTWQRTDLFPFELRRWASGIIVVVGNAEIPVQVPWECIGALINRLRTFKTVADADIDKELQEAIPIAINRYLIDLLEKACIVTRQMDRTVALHPSCFG